MSADITPNIDGYELIREINRGGMAEVYLARQSNLDRMVALKIMSSRLNAIPDFHARFLREARIVAKLNHRNIVTIYDVGESNGLLYISMELLEGGDLKEKISAGIPVSECLQITQDIASALSAAHEKGYVHRDIKPENVLFDGDGKLVLTDFGIAKSLEVDATQLTQTGMSLGTPAYMSPEQFLGGEIDGRSDLYSVGVMLFEMLAGEKPYKANTMPAYLHKHTSDPVPQLPEHVSYLQPLINELMAKNPDQRMESAIKLTDSINHRLEFISAESEAFLDDDPTDIANPYQANIQVDQVEAISPAVVKQDNRESSYPKPMAYVAASAFLVTMFVVFIWWQVNQTEPAEESIETAIDGIQLKRTRYVGKPMSVDYQDTPLRSVLEQISDFAEMSLLAPDDTAGSVTLRLNEVPWDEVLDLLAVTKGFDVTVTGRTILITNSRTNERPAEIDSNSPPKTLAEVEAMYSIAVLPFANMSSSETTGFFATGLSEEILDNLAQADWLKVTSRSASFQFTGLGVDPSKVGVELYVSYLLEGSVRQADDKLRITAQLIRTEDGFHVWSKSYEGMPGGFELQTAVAVNIARFAETMLEYDVFKNHEWKLKSWTADIDPIAIQHYMTAGDISRQENGDLDTAAQFLRNAVAVDPKFYAAYIDLTNSYIFNHRRGTSSLQEARPAAHAAIASALELLPDFADSLHMLALVHLFLDLDYASADAVMKRELALEPEYGWSHIRLANIALREGRTSDALKRIASTSENIRESMRVGFLSNVAGDYEGSLKASVKRAKLFLEGQEKAAHLRLHATSLVMLGRTEEAKPLIEEGWQLDGVTNPEPYVALFAHIGEIEKSKNILSDSRFDLTNHYYLAEGYVALNDTDNTFKSILAGIEERNQHLIESLIVAEWWGPIRDDPRFYDMLKLLDYKVTHTEQYLRDHDTEQN